MDKKLRQTLKKKKFKNRITRFKSGWMKEYKEWYNAETVDDIMKLKCVRAYQNHSTICSCEGCRGNRYNRCDIKKETKRILKESL